MPVKFVTPLTVLRRLTAQHGEKNRVEIAQGDVKDICAKRIVLAVTIIFFLTFAAFSQTSTGEVNGTLTDPTGAAVPGASIRLINEATKIETRATSKQDGYFTLVNVVPGRYALRVELAGFKTAITSSFALGVSETVTQNIVLAVGDVNETVEITSGAEGIQTSSTELGTVIA